MCGFPFLLYNVFVRIGFLSGFALCVALLDFLFLQILLYFLTLVIDCLLQHLLPQTHLAQTQHVSEMLPHLARVGGVL